jgi:zinc protease
MPRLGTPAPLRRLVLAASLLVACRNEAPPASLAVPASPSATQQAEAATSVTPPPPALPDTTPLPLWDAVRKRRLPNGLTTYVMRHPHPKNRVHVWLAVDVGSTVEADDERGLAHLVEHMAFSGTRRFPGNAVVAWAEGLGMRFGAHVNAFTSFDATTYQLEVPGDDPAHLAQALDVLRDWVSDIAFEPAALDRERSVVLEERRLGRGVAERLFERHLPVLFRGSRYADREPIGLPDFIREAPRDRLTAWYRRWYRPELMAVFIVGDVDPARAEAAIDARFADLASPPGAPARPLAGLPEPGLRVSIATDPELPAPSVSWYELLPRRTEATRADYRRALAEMLWQAALDERLATLARQPDAPFLGAALGIDTPVRELDALAGQVAPKPGRIAEALAALLRERRRVELSGLTPDEVRRARDNLARFYEDYDRGFETTESQLFADEMTRNFFEGELMVGAPAEKAMALSLLPAITDAEIAAAGRAFAASERKVLVVSAPTAAEVPDEAALRAVIAEAEAATDLARPVEAAVSGPLVSQPPAPGAVLSERTIPELGAVVWELANGVRVFVRPTDFERDAFTLIASSPGGYAAVSDADWPQARFAMSALAEGGLGDRDPIALSKALAGRSASAEAWVGETSEGVTAGGSPRDLATAFELLWLALTAPRADPEAIARWREATATALENELRDPGRRFAVELSEALASAHPRSLRPTPAALRAVDPARALALHRDRFGDLSDLVVAIVGDLDLTTLRPLVERWLGALPAAGRRETERDLGVRHPPGLVRRVWRLGQEERATVHLRFHAETPWDRDAERDLRILADVFDLRLREVLRDGLGGVYGVDVSASFARVPVGRRVLAIDFGCEPARVDELVKAVHAAIAAVAKDGVPDELLARVREQALRGREAQHRSNAFWADWLVTAARLGEDPLRVLDPAPFLARLTSDRVRDAASRFAMVPPVSGGPRGTSLFEAVLLPEASARDKGDAP